MKKKTLSIVEIIWPHRPRHITPIMGVFNLDNLSAQISSQPSEGHDAK